MKAWRVQGNNSLGNINLKIEEKEIKKRTTTRVYFNNPYPSYENIEVCDTIFFHKWFEIESEAIDFYLGRLAESKKYLENKLKMVNKEIEYQQECLARL